MDYNEAHTTCDTVRGRRSGSIKVYKPCNQCTMVYMYKRQVEVTAHYCISKLCKISWFSIQRKMSYLQWLEW